MLKTIHNGIIRLITQPDHAAVSGYMAAHWGNEEFSKLGYFDDSSEPEQLAAETTFGIPETYWEIDE